MCAGIHVFNCGVSLHISPVLFAVNVRHMAFRAVQLSRPQTLQNEKRSWTLEQTVYKGNLYFGTPAVFLGTSLFFCPLYRGRKLYLNLMVSTLEFQRLDESATYLDLTNYLLLTGSNIPENNLMYCFISCGF